MGTRGASTLRKQVTAGSKVPAIGRPAGIE
jgi:hypothetical protein